MSLFTVKINQMTTDHIHSHKYQLSTSLGLNALSNRNEDQTKKQQYVPKVVSSPPPS